jgi:hypothetical protein
MQFALVSVMGLAIRVPILHYVEPLMENLAQLLGLDFGGLFAPDMLGDNLTLALAVFIVMFWNFFANRYWTYADVDTVNPV